MFVRVSTLCMVAALLAVVGCTAQKATKGGVAANSGPQSATLYSPARNGLPGTKIWKSQIKMADVNGDGNDDIAAVSRLFDGPYVWLSDGKGNWTNASNGLPREVFCGGGVDFGDINKDGFMDIAIADHCKGVYALTGDGKGNWKSSWSGLPTIGAEDIALGDFNNDGCLDLSIVASQEEGIRAYAGNCKGNWVEKSEGLPHAEWGNGVVMGDMNKDGNVDIIAAYAAGPRVYLGDGKGNWKEASAGLPAPEVHGLYWGIAVGDVNNDGLLDVASGAAIPGVEVFLQQPDGSYVASSEGITAMNALGVDLADVDKDGNLDLIAAGKTALDEIGGVYGIHLFKGDGTGKWTRVSGSGLPATGRERTWGVTTGDVNHDGVIDIGAAFGDVISPEWRSGQAKDKDKEKTDEKKPKGPDRGQFGSVEVWTGTLKK